MELPALATRDSYDGVADLRSCSQLGWSCPTSGDNSTPTPSCDGVVASQLARTRQCSRAVPARRCYRRRVIETRSADGASVSHDDGWRLMLHDVSISQLVATLWKRPRAAHIYTEPNAVNWRAHGAGETPNMFINDKTRKHRFDCCGTCRTRTSQSARAQRALGVGICAR